MCHYAHLTPFEREKILFFLAEGKSITEIAHLLNRSKSTNTKFMFSVDRTHEFSVRGIEKDSAPDI